jgi:hypothetical protein
MSVAAAVILLACSAALGHGGRAVRVTSSFSYPAYAAPQMVFFGPICVVGPPIYAVPAAPLVTVPAPFAVPTAAPPSSGSQTAEPPLVQGTVKAPKVTESRFQGGTKVVKAEGHCCQVGFWNVSGRGLTLTIDGKKQVLARNQNLTLRLARQFSWQVDQGGVQTEQVPADKNTLEIVIRR